MHDIYLLNQYIIFYNRVKPQGILYTLTLNIERIIIANTLKML